jgi:hypothetical protein
MLVRCVSTSVVDLPLSYSREGSVYGEDYVPPLTVGKTYVVYAATAASGGMWYYLADDNELYYPVWYPAPLFGVVDGRLSRYWIYGYTLLERGEADYPIFAFKEWATDPYFYDRLTDGDGPAVAIYQKYKNLMDREAVLTDLKSILFADTDSRDEAYLGVSANETKVGVTVSLRRGGTVEVFFGREQLEEFLEGLEQASSTLRPPVDPSG